LEDISKELLFNSVNLTGKMGRLFAKLSANTIKTVVVFGEI
jgi:hypothetical protein